MRHEGLGLAGSDERSERVVVHETRDRRAIATREMLGNVDAHRSDSVDGWHVGAAAPATGSLPCANSASASAAPRL
jgi:hypothetical protein